MIYSDSVYNLKINYSAGLGGKQNYGGNVNDIEQMKNTKNF